MSLTSVIVVYAVTWFMVFFIVLPLRFVSQADAGSVVPGTPASAPAGAVVRRKAWITTIAATVVWAVICGTILSGWISVRDFDLRGVLDAPPAADGTGG
jgi:predicted secreted protein